AYRTAVIFANESGATRLITMSVSPSVEPIFVGGSRAIMNRSRAGRKRVDRRGSSVAVVCDDVEVPDLMIVVGKQRRRLLVDDRPIELVAGERADGIQRLPPRGDDDLDAAVLLAFEQPRTAVTGYRRQLRHDDAPEMLR